MASQSISRPAVRPLLVGLTFIGFISLGLPDGLLGVAWPSIADHLGVGVEALGTLLACFSLGYLAISVQSGRLLARVGVGVLLAISCLATSLALLGFATTSSWLLLLPLAMLLGAGGGAIDAGLNAYAAEQYSPRTITWLHACYGLGAASGPALMSLLLASRQPWQYGYLIVGGGQLLLALAFVLTRRRWHAADDDNAAPQARPATALLDTFRRPVVLLSCLVFLIYTGAEVSIGQWSFTLLTIGRGVPEVVAGQWVSGYWAALTVGRILAGVAASRLSPTALLRIGAAGTLLGSGMIWLDSAGSLLSLFGLLIAGISLAPIFPALIATTPARVGMAHSANAVGFQVSAAMIGAAGIPWAIGQLIGVGGVPLIGIAIALSSIVYLAAYMALELSQRRRA